MNTQSLSQDKINQLRRQRRSQQTTSLPLPKGYCIAQRMGDTANGKNSKFKVWSKSGAIGRPDPKNPKLSFLCARHRVPDEVLCDNNRKLCIVWVQEGQYHAFVKVFAIPESTPPAVATTRKMNTRARSRKTTVSASIPTNNQWAQLLPAVRTTAPPVRTTAPPVRTTAPPVRRPTGANHGVVPTDDEHVQSYKDTPFYASLKQKCKTSGIIDDATVLRIFGSVFYPQEAALAWGDRDKCLNDGIQCWLKKCRIPEITCNETEMQANALTGKRHVTRTTPPPPVAKTRTTPPPPVAKTRTTPPPPVAKTRTTPPPPVAKTRTTPPPPVAKTFKIGVPSAPTKTPKLPLAVVHKDDDETDGGWGSDTEEIGSNTIVHIFNASSVSSSWEDVADNDSLMTCAPVA
jgi:hypothetical protein